MSGRCLDGSIDETHSAIVPSHGVGSLRWSVHYQHYTCESVTFVLPEDITYAPRTDG
jgi:hypothetical protein